MKIYQYRIIIKPALVVLVSAIVLYVVGVRMAHRYAQGAQTEYGLVHPGRWKFETMDGAQAALTEVPKRAAQPGVAEASPQMTAQPMQDFNADDGFTVTVKSPGKAAYDVYLRNGMTLSDVDPNANLNLSFEAQARSKFPVMFTVRGIDALQSSNALWSQQFTIGDGWETYHATIPMEKLRSESFKHFIVSVQLGAESGSVSLRHIYIR